MPTVKFKKLDEKAVIPTYAKAGDAGMDLVYIGECRWIAPGERLLAKTGLAIELPPGTQGEVRSRSGLALKNGVVVANSPGTIDEGYRGEVGAILLNTSTKGFHIETGMRVAQLVVMPYVSCEVEAVEELSTSERGATGFGSTGV